MRPHTTNGAWIYRFPAASATATAKIQGGPRGYDGGKKINGRKRHLLVDTMGLLINVVAHPANIADRDGAMLVFGGVADRFPRRKQVWADGGYQGGLRAWLGEHFRIRLVIVKKPSRRVWVPADVEPPPYPKGFQVLKRRWVVEPGAPWAVSAGSGDTGG